MIRQFKILIADGHGEQDEIARYLSAAGHQCFVARGPLRVRSLLNSCAADAIVWIDHSGAADLHRDFFWEWKQFPRIPVVHLFPAGTGTNTADYSTQIAEAMPYDAFESRLIPALDRLLHAGFTEHGEPAEARTELAFRNIFYHMRNRPETPNKSEHQESGPADFHLSVTSINPTEREQLVPGKSGARQAKDELPHDRKSEARAKP